MDDELLCDGARVALPRIEPDDGRRRLSRRRGRLARYARSGARRLHRVAESCDVRRAVPVRARPRRQSPILRKVGFAGSGPPDRRSRLADWRLSVSGRPPAALALAASARGDPARCRIRPGRRRSWAYRLAATGGASALRAGWARFPFWNRRPPRPPFVFACGGGG